MNLIYFCALLLVLQCGAAVGAASLQLRLADDSFSIISDGAVSPLLATASGVLAFPVPPSIGSVRLVAALGAGERGAAAFEARAQSDAGSASAAAATDVSATFAFVENAASSLLNGTTERELDIVFACGAAAQAHAVTAVFQIDVTIDDLDYNASFYVAKSCAEAGASLNPCDACGECFEVNSIK